MMAEAVGKATGRPGICFVTRGPGATNASPGIHIAQQDSTPMILFVGQVGRDMREREAFQEIDYRAVFGTMTKWVTEIDDPARMPEFVSRAFYTATSGRPGPVVIALPEDMLAERVDVPSAPAFEPVETWPGATDMMKLQKLLVGGRASARSARRQPLVGSGVRGDDALRRALRAAGGDHLPPRAPVRCAAPLLCGRSRHRPQSETARPRQGSRPRRPGRRPARRDAVAGLYAVRHSGAADDARARPSRRRGTRPRLSAASRHPRGADRLRRCAEGLQPPNEITGARRPGPPMPIISPGARRRPRSPAASISARSWCGCATTCRPTRCLQRRRQLFHLDPPLLSLPPLRHADSRRSPARWATACRRRSR